MKNKPIKIGMKPSHPGAFIRTEIIDELGLRVTEAADVLRVRRATLSDLLNEKAALSPEMALRLEKAFNLNMDMLLRMQAWHDASEMDGKHERSQWRRVCLHGHRHQLARPEGVEPLTLRSEISTLGDKITDPIPH